MPFPKAKEGPLTQDRLRELLHYDPETGLFIRRVTTAARATAGTIAGDMDSKGYWRLRVDRKRYLAHRLAWFYVHGEWPEEIDHINCKRTDNRLCNLRPATSGRWRASIYVDGKSKWLGVYDTPEEANAAYSRAAIKYFGQFARAA